MIARSAVMGAVMGNHYILFKLEQYLLFKISVKLFLCNYFKVILTYLRMLLLMLYKQ